VFFRRGTAVADPFADAGVRPHHAAMALLQFGEDVPGYPVRVLNEREARAAAGIMFACGLAMFVYSLQTMDFRYSQIFITTFMVDFLIRVFVNPRFSPTMILGRLAVSRQTPEYVGAAQKRFAWSIGVLLSVPMFILVVVMGVMTPWKIAICGVCLALMFSETAFGICIGCVLYTKLTGQQPVLCPGDVCQVRVKEPIQHIAPGQALIAAVAVLVVGGLTARAALEGPPVAAPVAPVSADAGAWAPVLVDVEAIRAALADDQVAGVAERAARIASAVDAMPDATPAAAAVARAARDLSTRGEAPIGDVRSSFGELMRALIAQLIAEPHLRAGFFLFECPMTSTYPRWVQRSATMANPYMGSRMLMCGAAISPWSVGGS
jgi:hypothetical protein